MKKRSIIYRELEEKMVKYADLVSILVRPSSERMVAILQTSNLIANQIGTDMQKYTPRSIYARQGTTAKLKVAADMLAGIYPTMQLEVVYGYRTLSIQKKLFKQFKKQLEAKYSDELELLEAVHRKIAVPSVAGHPTGGAVDIQILKAGKPINMGTKIWEFNNDSFTFSPFISLEAKKNRQLLRNIMMETGFAPYDGEWWHFSYGDKEWAKYYQKPFAIYEQIEFKNKV